MLLFSVLTMALLFVWIQLSHGGSRMRNYDPPPNIGAMFEDARNRYAEVRFEDKQTRGGFAHAWARSDRVNGLTLGGKSA